MGPVRIRSITVPGILLQGGRIDMALDLEPANALSRGTKLEVLVSGTGLSSETVVDDASMPNKKGVVARVVASVDAAPGVRDVTLKLTPPSGEVIVQTASLIVHTPIELRPRENHITVTPGEPVVIGVGVIREPGFDGEVQVRLGLPEGMGGDGEDDDPGRFFVCRISSDRHETRADER